MKWRVLDASGVVVRGGFLVVWRACCLELLLSLVVIGMIHESG